MEVTQRPRIAFIPRISPSRGAALLACGLSEAFRAAHSAPRLATHPKAHFGILAHDFLACAASGLLKANEPAALRAMWKRAVEEYEQQIASDEDERSVLPLSRTCRDFEVNALLIIKAASALASSGETFSAKPRGGVEHEISSGDGLVVGRIDRLRWRGGHAIVTDFKTGSSTDETGQLRADLVIQLKLYAYLVHETEREWPVIQIQSPTAAAVPVPYEPSGIENLVRALKEKREAVNNSVEAVLRGEQPETVLASPSPLTCRFCVYRGSCTAYWIARNSWEPDARPPDIEGQLVARKEQGSDFLLLELETVEGPSSIRAFRLSMLRDTTVLQIGQRIGICELWRERAPRTYSCQPITILLAL